MWWVVVCACMLVVHGNQNCEEGEWSCQRRGGNLTSSCISLHSPCHGVCWERYVWCEESQQCIMHKVKCSIMWGVGCGKSSYFCWQGNVCLPRSVPCNGYCTKHYRKKDRMSCVFDPDSLLQEEVEDNDTRTGGTLAPIITIVILMLSTVIGIIMMYFRKHIQQQIEKITKKKPREEREPSMSELEVMELDPFSSESRHIKTFSVRNEIEDSHQGFHI